MNEKCQYFDQGYCKEKNNCIKLHPSVDCNGECKDIKVCSRRHRKICKNGDTCIFNESQSSEFEHDGNIIADDTERREMLVNLNNEIKSVNNKLKDLEVHLVESQNRFELIKILENKVSIIEKEKSNLKIEGHKLLEKVNDIEEEYSNKLEEIEHKLESVIVALNTAQNSSPIARTIKTGKRKLTEENLKKERRRSRAL